MKFRFLTGLVAIPALLAVAGLFLWWWLLHTEAGARWVFERAAAAANGSLAVNSISGDLVSGLQLEGLYFEQGGIRAEVETVRATINIDLLPVAVEVTTLHAETVRLQVTDDPGDASGDNSSPGSFAMPFPLTFRDVRLSGIEYLDSSGEATIVINSIESAGSLNEALVLDRFSVLLPEDGLELSGQVTLATPHPLALKFQSQGRLALEGTLKGNLDSAELVLDIADPQVHVSGTLGQLLDAPVWDLEVSSPSIHFPPQSPDPAATFTGLRAQTVGEWPLFSLDLAADLEVTGQEPAQIQLSGSGSENDFAARKLLLQGPGLSVEASGFVSWEDTLRLGLNATIDSLDPRTWIPDWPENHPLSGQIEAGWEGADLVINDFSLLVSGTDLAANGHGIVALESGIVDVALNWENFSWPPGSPSPTVASEHGSLRISGQPERWELGGTLDLRSGDFPPGLLQLSGEGDQESLNITVQEGSVLGGTVSGSIFWNWTETQPFNAKILVQQVDITPLHPDYPGVLSAKLVVNGEVEPFRLAIEIQQLEGTIREHPVTGRGGLAIEQDRVIANQLHLASGSSTLNLDGSLYDPKGIDFSTDIDSLARFSEGLQGGLAATGNISLNPESPRISVSLSGQNLVLGPVKIGQIETRKSSGSGFEDGNQFIFSDLVIKQQHVETLSISLGGEEPLQRIAVTARVEGTDIALDLRGSVTDWKDPLASGWRGELADLRIDHRDGFFLALDQPAAVEWTPALFTLEPACHSGAGDARLCLSSAGLGQDQLNVSAQMTAIPVSLIGLLVDTELKFSQALSGTFDWSQSAADGNRGSARIEILPGTISVVDDDERLLDTGPGLFSFELAGGTLKDGNLDLTIPGTGEIDVNFNIPDLSLGAYSLIRGKLRVDIDDLSSLGPILPLFDSISGAMDIDVSLSGVLEDPAFIGKMSLTNGRFATSASGTSFSDINISGDVTDSDRAELNGTFRAGEGIGTIATIIYFENVLSPVVELSLKGESLTIIDVPELNIIANPDLELSWRDTGMEVNGRLFIPRARLAPTQIPRSSVGQSADVVIVAGELPAAETESWRDKPLRIRGSLEVELGEQAEIALNMARVNVYGTTRFTWQDELLPLANGNFDIRGEVQAYGQLLRITRGRISFPDIPADNPHLNIRAERDIFGNLQIQKAGLMVTGTLRRPLIEPYTTPMTNKDRARTLLVTGSDFNYEQGVGAVAVGYYVLPRLYVSYGIGVFEDGNVISIRYDLGSRFGIRVTSGQRDTGVDLNYTIER